MQSSRENTRKTEPLHRHWEVTDSEGNSNEAELCTPLFHQLVLTLWSDLRQYAVTHAKRCFKGEKTERKTLLDIRNQFGFNLFSFTF